jgi:hypothetical protein
VAKRTVEQLKALIGERKKVIAAKKGNPGFRKRGGTGKASRTSLAGGGAAG